LFDIRFEVFLKYIRTYLKFLGEKKKKLTSQGKTIMAAFARPLKTTFWQSAHKTDPSVGEYSSMHPGRTVDLPDLSFTRSSLSPPIDVTAAPPLVVGIEPAAAVSGGIRRVPLLEYCNVLHACCAWCHRSISERWSSSWSETSLSLRRDVELGGDKWSLDPS